MSATVALVRIQLHFLKWPLAAALTCMVLAVMIPSDLWKDHGGAPITFIVLSVAVWLSAPVLFGSEFVEGARDYIATRPVSGAKVFWTKTALLTGFIVLCDLALHLAIREFTIGSFLMLLVLPLALAYSCQIATLVTKDLVRGILLGPVIFVSMIALTAALFYLVTLHHFTVLSTGGSWTPWTRTPKNDHTWGALLDLQFVSLPFVGLWLAFLIDDRRRYGVFRWRRMISPLLVPVLVSASLAGFFLYNEGRTVLWRDPFSQPGTCCSARAVFNNRLYYVSGRVSLEYKGGGFTLSAVDGNSGFARPEVLGEFGCEIDEEYQKKGINTVMIRRFQAYLGANRIALIDRFDTRGYIYSYERDGKMGLFKTLDLPQKVQYVNEVGTDRVRLTSLDFEKGVDGQDILTQALWRDLDLVSGEVGDATPVDLEEALESACPADKRAYMRLSNTFGTGAVTPTSFAEGTLGPDAVDETLEARLGSDNEIHLTDTSVPEAPTMCDLDLPARLKWEPLRVSRLGEDSDANKQFMWRRVTLGGGFLFYWLLDQRRIAVWDVRKINNIMFCGMSALPNPVDNPVLDSGSMKCHGATGNGLNVTRPVVRVDGALGLVMEYGDLMWFEFPALMKEAKS